MVINLVCVCFLILFHQDKHALEIPAVSYKMPVLVNATSASVVPVKRNTPVSRGNKNSINYPNPFSSSTTISYNITVPGNVTITLFNLLGREVCGYNEGFKGIGESKIRIDLDFLNSGVYFYEIKVDGMRQAFNRLTLLK